MHCCYTDYFPPNFKFYFSFIGIAHTPFLWYVLSIHAWMHKGCNHLTLFKKRNKKKSWAKNWKINFIDIPILTAMWYLPSHRKDGPHYLQNDRPFHYNHPAPRLSSSLPSAKGGLLFSLSLSLWLMANKKVNRKVEEQSKEKTSDHLQLSTLEKCYFRRFFFP